MTGQDQQEPDGRPATPPPPPPPPASAPSAGGGWGPSPDAPRYGATPSTPGYGPPPSSTPGYGPPQHGAPPSAPGYGPPPSSTPGYGPPASTPGYGPPQYGAHQYGAHQYGAPRYGAPGQAGAAPVQRGIVPLRPLSLGEFLDGAFRAVRHNPRVMFGLSAVVVLVTSLVSVVTELALIPSLNRSVGGAFDGWGLDAQESLGLEEQLVGTLSMLGTMPFWFLAVTVLTGLLTASVSQSVIGRRLAAGDLWNRYWRRLVLLVGWSLLLQLLLLVPWVLLGVAVWTLMATGQLGAAVAVGLLGILPLVVASVWVYVRVLLIPPAIVLEGKSLWSSVRRGWLLTRGSFWRLLGIYLLCVIIVVVITSVLTVPVGILAVIVTPDPTSPQFIALTTFGSALGQILTTVFLAAVIALLYIDARMRREGLDVALARAAEESAGQETTGR